MDILPSGQCEGKTTRLVTPCVNPQMQSLGGANTVSATKEDPGRQQADLQDEKLECTFP